MKLENTRIEKKFISEKYKKDFFERILVINNFRKIFPDREITSIYVDTLDYNFAKDNINGVSERKKIRFRWYNDNLEKIFLEIKNKRNFNVWKNIKKISSSKDKKNLLENLKNFLQNSKIENINNFNFQFVLKTNYKRSYWLSSNNKIRATIDIDINASSLNNFTKPIYLGDTVLEFKFNPQHEEYFRNFLSNRFDYLRAQKYSKYVRSFIELENSGINY